MKRSEQIGFLNEALLAQMPEYREEAARIAVSTVRGCLRESPLERAVFFAHGDGNLRICQPLLCE